MKRPCHAIVGSRRPAVVAVVLLVLMTVLLGFAALTVDVGAIYGTRADLQRAADAAAMAATIELSNSGLRAEGRAAARLEAQRIVEANPVLGETVTIAPEADVVFGRAAFDSATDTFRFVPTNIFPDSVRVTVRKTSESPNGQLPLFFAPIFGRNYTNVSATATASMVARDISIVADVSGSQDYDSQLRYYRNRDVNTYELWTSLPGGSDDIDSTWGGEVLPADPAQSAGPGWGFFRRLAYGDDVTDPNYDPANDPGMISLPLNQSWNNATLRSYLGDQGYSGAEVDAILTPNGENSGGSSTRRSRWRARVAVALGLARWNSGMAGGLGDVMGVPPSDAGNGDSGVRLDELEWVEQFPGATMADSRQFWMNYIWSQGTSTRSRRFDNRFGLKTVVDRLANDQARYRDMSPDVANMPVQPLYAQKLAINTLVEFFSTLGSADMLALEIYQANALHLIDLTDDHQAVGDRMTALSPAEPGMTGGTNIGEGMRLGIAELTSSRNRVMARRVMIVITDGLANRGGGGMNGRDWALYQAGLANDQDIQVISVTVGQGADQALMAQVAARAGGRHYHADGTFADYTAGLTQIFGEIGLRRTVTLIE